jgi:transposase InsO family protein
MKPEYKLKYAILALQAEWDEIKLPKNMSEDDIEIFWDEADCLQDAKSEIRCSGISTGLPCDYSRHYESEAVAVQCPNGDWVGFTYWHGGGKHGEPEAIDWIPYAYDVDCVSEEKLVVVHTFSKRGDEK